MGPTGQDRRERAQSEEGDQDARERPASGTLASPASARGYRGHGRGEVGSTPVTRRRAHGNVSTW
ncbi:MAG TPA: hypothetical protein VFN59_03215 [Acidimicrobiales bacterium]|nr:hypothetical protein [Acidimicrobiales bacterium]